MKWWLVLAILSLTGGCLGSAQELAVPNAVQGSCVYDIMMTQNHQDGNYTVTAASSGNWDLAELRIDTTADTDFANQSYTLSDAYGGRIERLSLSASHPPYLSVGDVLRISDYNGGVMLFDQGSRLQGGFILCY